MQHLENCMFSLTVHCDHQSYLVSSDRPFVVVLGKQLRGEYWDFYPEKGGLALFREGLPGKKLLLVIAEIKD